MIPTDLVRRARTVVAGDWTISWAISGCWIRSSGCRARSTPMSVTTGWFTRGADSCAGARRALPARSLPGQRGPGHGDFPGMSTVRTAIGTRGTSWATPSGGRTRYVAEPRVRRSSHTWGVRSVPAGRLVWNAGTARTSHT